jgi:phenylacetate-CoA ligase
MSKMTDRIYAASPVWMQQLGVSVFGWYWSRRRLGPIFERTWREYVERENWSADRMHDFVEQQLRAQVQRAYHQVPYYRDAFRKHGVTEQSVNHFTVGDLPRLPLLHKATVRADSKVLLTEKAAKNPPDSFNTSGTTGTPIRVFVDPPTHQHNIAVREARLMRWAGVSYREPRASIGMRLVVPKVHSRPPFWRYNRWERQVYFSAFHISPANVPDYVAALNLYRPVTLVAWPSTAYFLAKCISEGHLEVHSPRAIITTSEALRPHMRQTVEAVFQSRAYQEYGLLENCGIATECESGNFHVHIDFGYLEILRPDGSNASPGELGEVVLTGFANPNQIFIRYRTGDLASWATQLCACGRNTLPALAEVVGRIEDTIALPDGRRTPRLDFLFKELSGVAEAQIIQETLDRLVVRIVPTPSYSPADEDAIRKRAAQRLGSEITVEVHTVTNIPREPNGKLRAVVSRVTNPASSFVVRD